MIYYYLKTQFILEINTFFLHICIYIYNKIFIIQINYTDKYYFYKEDYCYCIIFHSCVREEFIRGRNLHKISL